MGKPLEEVVEAGWARALAPVAQNVSDMGDFLRAEIAAGRRYLPAGANVLRAFTQPFDAVRVLIVGQDPYPTPGHAVGLSFSVSPQTRPVPRSLANIFREYTDDLGHPTPSTGDLTPWAEQGVLLLNRVLTVEPGQPASHRGKGWEAVTEQAIRALVDRDAEPLVAILWGSDARKLAAFMPDVPTIESAHPSPMSADRGFFGSRPFSKANALLEEIGGDPVDWKLLILTPAEARELAGRLRADGYGRQADDVLRPRGVTGVWRSRPPLWVVLLIASRDGALLIDGDAFALRDPPRAEARRMDRLAWLDRAWDVALFGLPLLAVMLVAAVLALAGAPPVLVLGLVVAAMVGVVLVLGAVLARLVTAVIRRRPVETAVEQLRAVNPTLTLLHAPTPAQATGLVAHATALGGPLLVLVAGITRARPDRVGPDGLRVDPLSDGHPVLVAHRPADPLPRAPSGPGRLRGPDIAVVLGGSAAVLAIVAAFVPSAEGPGASITGYGDAVYWMANRLLGGDPDGLGVSSAFGRIVGVLVTVYGLYVLVAIVGAVVRQRIADDQRSASDVVAGYAALRAAGPYPESPPHASGMLDVGDRQRVYWETCGNPDGAPAVVLHGGPGSGASRWWTGLLDPAAYRIVLFDQRGCGRSTPDVADPGVPLDTNTISHLVADVEALRTHLGVERWLVLGASWGSTLALAYAQRYPRAVSAMVLFSVVGTTHREVEWVTRGMRRFLPLEWARFRDAVPAAQRDGNLADAYARLLGDRDPNVRDRAAREWCAWEERHVAAMTGPIPEPRYADPAFRMRFARLVTHYWRNAAWLGEDELIEGAARLVGVPGVLIHGRGDVSSPPEFAHRVHDAWPGSELMLVDGAGHGADAAMTRAVIAATDRLRPART